MKLVHLAYRVAQRARRIYWRIAKPTVHGVKVIVLGDDDHVLLVRHSYQSSDMFMLPGGGRNRHEDAMQAGAREVREETGCELRDIRLHGHFISTAEGAQNHITVLIGRTDGPATVDGREILEASFLPIHQLPANISPSTLRRLIEVRDGLPPADSW